MVDIKQVLLIGGTSEAVRLNEKIAAFQNIKLITSLAGRTKAPVSLQGEVLAHGFAEAGGLEALLLARNIDCVIDASHPFAQKMSVKASAICKKLEVPYLRYDRDEWQIQAGDNWILVADTPAAAGAASAYSRIFLSIGRQEVAAFETLIGKQILIRSIEPISFSPTASTITELKARGPFSVEQELRLFEAQNIDVVVSKNSGGAATYAKIEAARALSLPVIMIERPQQSNEASFNDIDDLIRQMQLCV